MDQGKKYVFIEFRGQEFTNFFLNLNGIFMVKKRIFRKIKIINF
jgi:hypothetical protein